MKRGEKKNLKDWLLRQETSRSGKQSAFVKRQPQEEQKAPYVPTTKTLATWVEAKLYQPFSFF